MEVIIIIIIGIVVSLLSAASKKKPRRDAEEAPARPTLSDIQRAFMMSSEMETQKRAPEIRQVYPFNQPVQQTAAAPAQPAVTPQPYAASAPQPSNRYANINLATFHTDSGEISDAPKKIVRHQKSSLKLFEDKSDFVRAVIYSEILTRKTR